MPQDITAKHIPAMAASQGLAIPPECAAGVAANLALFLEHARIVAAADDAETDPAELLRP